MTAPDSRDSVEKIVAEMRSREDLVDYEIADYCDRLQALARGPQQAGGEDYARLWRNRWISDRTAYWQPTAGNYESARIRAEAEAADYEQTFDAARERLRNAAISGGQDDA